MTSTRLSLRDRLRQDPPRLWTPWRADWDGPDELIGDVLDVSREDTKHQDNVLFLTVADETGQEWRVPCYHAALERELQRQKVAPGAQVGIRYIGPPDGTRRGHAYRVVVEHTQDSDLPF